MALGEMALESGDYAAARWDWERIIPSNPPESSPRTWPGYPDTNLDLATVACAAGADLDSRRRAGAERAELAELARLHPEARGRLGGREGKYTDLLATLLAESASWPAMRSDLDWPTFGGDFCAKQRIAASGRCRRGDLADSRCGPALKMWIAQLESSSPGEDPREPLSFHPLLVGNRYS